MLEQVLARVMDKGIDELLPIRHKWFTVFAQNSNGRPALVIDFRANLPFIDGAKGFTTFLDEREDRSYLRISSTERLVRPAFVALSQYLLSESAKAQSYEQAVDLFLRALESFRELLARKPGRLGDEAIRGLFAEISVLTNLMGMGYDAEVALRAWKGPFRSPQDFVFPSGHCIEVKSTHRPAKKVRISSVDQLEVSDATLQLVVVPLERCAVGDGKGLLELVAEVSDSFSHSLNARSMWEEALASINIDLDDEYYREWSFEVGLPLVFYVEDGFPRLRSADIPSGIGSVSYSIDVAEIEQFLDVLPQPDLLFGKV